MDGCSPSLTDVSLPDFVKDDSEMAALFAVILDRQNKVLLLYLQQRGEGMRCRRRLGNNDDAMGKSRRLCLERSAGDRWVERDKQTCADESRASPYRRPDHYKLLRGTGGDDEYAPVLRSTVPYCQCECRSTI
jgi:hypothetical protein